MPPHAIRSVPIVYKTGEGYWGPVTANIDWCEGNYEVTVYIAEFWNTISSLVIFLLPFFAGYMAYISEKVEFRHTAVLFAMTAVGAGSVMFHMTLLSTMQLFDEIPMIIAASIHVYNIQQIESKSDRKNVWLLVGLGCGFFIQLYAYFAFGHRLFFELAYLVLIVFSNVNLALLTQIIDREIFRLVVMGFVLYISGGVVWLVDRVECDRLTAMRSSLLPYSVFRPFTQLHAVWHVLSALASFVLIVASIQTRFALQGRKKQMKLLFGFFPVYGISKRKLTDS